MLLLSFCRASKKLANSIASSFELLKLFIENPNKVFSREEILKLVWHDDVCVLDRTVDVNITRVRKKIGAYGANLVSRQGYGYSFRF